MRHLTTARIHFLILEHFLDLPGISVSGEHMGRAAANGSAGQAFPRSSNSELLAAEFINYFPALCL